MTQLLTLTELEGAINYWRKQSPSVGEESRLCPQAAALATPYAAMIMSHAREMPIADLAPAAREAVAQWRSATGQAPR